MLCYSNGTDIKERRRSYHTRRYDISYTMELPDESHDTLDSRLEIVGFSSTLITA